jgi:tetratricopeptide (TPR) repeat protein
MLSQFKQKVAENVSLSDSTAHYDLGLAFKDMGLIDEAIAEFQVALKGGEERLKVYEELGQCFLLKQQYNVAVTILKRASALPVRDDADLLGVYYALGRAHEELGQSTEARAAYERVVGFDIKFRDAAKRLGKL